VLYSVSQYQSVSYTGYTQTSVLYISKSAISLSHCDDEGFSLSETFKNWNRLFLYYFFKDFYSDEKFQSLTLALCQMVSSTADCLVTRAMYILWHSEGYFHKGLTDVVELDERK